MANMASGMYQQMVVPAPYHFHQPQPQPTPTVTQEPEPKKEPKKRKKPAEKANGEKKKPRIIGQTAYMAGLRLDSGDVGGEQRGECSRCNKKKCFKHADAKNKNQMSKKTPEDTVLQMKKHMLKLLSNHDYPTFCKNDQKNGQIDVDISKMHRSYLEEHEPQAFEPPPSNDPNREYKPKVKQWLYRKIFLDEFKTFEYNACKRHIGDLRRSIESVMIQKKKKAPKPKPPAPPPPQQQQVMPQDYSMNNHALNNGGPQDMSRTAIPPGTIIAASPHPPASTAPGGYQPNLMNLGVDTSSTPVSSMATMGATSTLHNSLATYMTQQVQPNILFGLGQQQQPPPAQQQPLNLQTSHQGQPAMQPPPHQPPGTSAAPTAAPPLPLNLHNPYYVSLGPMLPLPMSTPQHNHQQQFQQNMLQQQQGIPGGFNQHTMYQ
ncbi:uncharacterized protein LOC119576109 isoform X1 [Penaeus monodon]|uniref:uncharacterized protein LOC119576109 isoform X1 n=1 Tax=Penaeus monodon TaxID=6687 RepID=UPI0018A7A524|nr:uncharacterized protein LOC119576109 isoform X1 [Penaeus monodon]